MIDDKHGVDGAADVSDFLEQFVLARDEESAAGMNSSPGETCTE